MKTININSKQLSDIYLDVSTEKLNAPKVISKPRKLNPLIAVEHVSKVFGKGKNAIHAVKDLSLNIFDKENLALLGANGAGKTTLIEMIVGINKPTSGKIHYNYKYRNSYQEGIGVQFQDSSYPIGLKVKNIVEFMIEVYDVKINDKELKHMIKMFGLEPFWKKHARSLSGGQQQRLNVLLALLHKPKVVFLDELSTGLDISVREQIKTFVYDYCKMNNINIVLISHDIAEVNLLCDRIVIMQKGQIKVDIYKDEAIKKFGSIEKLLRKYI